MKNIIEMIEKTLEEKNTTILCRNIEIENLKKQLEAAEKEIADLKSQRELEESAAGNFKRNCEE